MHVLDTKVSFKSCSKRIKFCGFWRSYLDLKMKEEHKLTGRCDYSLAPEDFFIERVALAFNKNMQWIVYFNQQ